MITRFALFFCFLSNDNNNNEVMALHTVFLT